MCCHRRARTTTNDISQSVIHSPFRDMAYRICIIYTDLAPPPSQPSAMFVGAIEKSSFNPCPKRFRVSRVFDAGVSPGKTTQTVVQHWSPIVSLQCLSRLRGGYFSCIKLSKTSLANQASQPQPCSAAPQSHRWQSSAESDSGGRCNRSRVVGRARP